MAETKTTITTCKYNSSSPANLAWNTIATAVPTYFDVRGKDGSKIIFLVSHETTQAAMAGTTWYVGTSDTATTGTSFTRNFSARGLPRLKIKQAQYAKAKAQTKFRTSGTTHLVSIAVLGPFETARFKDTDGFIYLTKAKTGSTVTVVAAILIP
jgi:hypothetical protein